MKDRQALLAIDGGGSNGRAALDYEGVTFARSTPDGLNPIDVGYTEFEERLRPLVIPLLHEFGGKRVRVFACAAVAGAGDATVAETCKGIVQKVIEPEAARPRVRVLSDVAAMVEYFFQRHDGIVLIAGTGSVCVGVRHHGGKAITAKVGGWGGYLDQGSGFRTGLRVLEAVLKAPDRRRGASAMIRLLCEKYEIPRDGVASRFLPPDRAEVAKLTRVALEAYAEGDPSARALVRETVRDLADMVLAVKTKAHLGAEVNIVLSGGLLKEPVIHRLLEKRVRRSLPEASFHRVTDPLPHILELARRTPGVKS